MRLHGHFFVVLYFWSYNERAPLKKKTAHRRPSTSFFFHFFIPSLVDLVITCHQHGISSFEKKTKGKREKGIPLVECFRDETLRRTGVMKQETKTKNVEVYGNLWRKSRNGVSPPTPLQANGATEGAVKRFFSNLFLSPRNAPPESSWTWSFRPYFQPFRPSHSVVKASLKTARHLDLAPHLPLWSAT